MKKILPVLLLAFLAGKIATAQTTDTARWRNIIFTKAEYNPVYKGGDTAWIQFLNKNLNYPQEAMDKEQQGTIMVQFIVETDGKISDIKAITSPAKSLVKEAIRIVQLSDGNWEPAIQNGVKVRCYAKRPIQFKIVGGF